MQNEKLNKLYQDKYPILTKMIQDKNTKLKVQDRDSQMATNPLLLKSFESYDIADFKIMFFGQETNFWLKEINNGVFNGEILPILSLYERFFINGNCFRYGGQFWNGIKLFKNKVNKSFDEKKIEYIWNNIEKIGQCKKGFPHAISNITEKYFNVLQDEIEILKPDLLIFFTGPNYDSSIKKYFGEFEMKTIYPFNGRELCEIIIPNMPRSLRTYHPNYLWRSKTISSTFDKIIEKINH